MSKNVCKTYDENGNLVKTVTFYNKNRISLRLYIKYTYDRLKAKLWNLWVIARRKQIIGQGTWNGNYIVAEGSFMDEVLKIEESENPITFEKYPEGYVRGNDTIIRNVDRE